MARLKMPSGPSNNGFNLTKSAPSRNRGLRRFGGHENVTRRSRVIG